ncbi:MAG TPA: Grx4 family monothiol glutaredoxin [Polyangiaceae bacterium]|jgi:monothiol glutaredoxin|nr:Grx4 family monothiol glutaredoxin [Polyangiaceae bacterium]
MDDIKKHIEDTITGNRVVLFMKGTKNFPQCGFSSRAVEILKKCGVQFKDVNVLADPAVRQGIKDFSNWPTVPQVYIDGKFVGGSDILMDMFQSGELQKMLGEGTSTS